MDFTTTLITFMLQTTPSVQSVHLIGSWDNFNKRYPMERDSKRALGQWRGCYAFEDIICDGGGDSSPKRTGGLKMGSTYYYYYEIDDGIEIYDNTIPFTTSCPYLPGQPVNLLSVPVEVQPPRYRSASMSSMMNGDIKTMNPADKFLSPRPPPAPPILSRLNTSSSVLLKKRSARSVSPGKSPRSPWSPKAFFGRWSNNSSSLNDGDDRGRPSSPSINSIMQSQSANTSSELLGRSIEAKRANSISRTRDISPQSFKILPSREPSPLRQAIIDSSSRRPNSREPSPLRHSSTMESGSHGTSTLVIPDEIAEEIEDDDNFASHDPLDGKDLFTALSPPPSAIRSQFPRVGTTTDKPLPQLPENSPLSIQPPSAFPSPLHLRSPTSASQLPESHFSVSTISTTLTSPTDSSFGFSETPSISDSNDDEDLTVDISSGDESVYSPISAAARGRHYGYSLPDGDYASDQTIRKETPLSHLTQTRGRATFGGPVPFGVGAGASNAFGPISALEELLNEMGYLGDAITGK